MFSTELGPLTVWVTPDSWESKYEEKEMWTKVYDRTHEPSVADFVAITFD